MPAARAGHFDAGSAYRLAALQVRYGQRPAGSPQLRRMAGVLRPKLPGGHFESIPGEPKLRNVVGVLKGRRPAIVVGAHYDTLVKPDGFVGANNGAAGTAIVIQLARDLARRKRPRNAREVRFVLFDGEEPAAAGCPRSRRTSTRPACAARAPTRGAMRARRRRWSCSTTSATRACAFRGRAPRASRCGRRVRAAAGEVGVGAVFPPTDQMTILDDHTPFLRAGIPAVDLIDFSYRYADGLKDTLDKLSVASLDAVGETVFALVSELRAGSSGDGRAGGSLRC